jgi:2-keto-4-pentenoate hydratase/2-oxohepta-3-ene-1,7-dioic acid hydratase in catechol pathway
VNGSLRQDDSTESMIFPIDQIIEFLSGNNTLLPGTVILTGTPAGTGKQQSPSEYLKPGDVVRVEIEGIGALENPVIAR